MRRFILLFVTLFLVSCAQVPIYDQGGRIVGYNDPTNGAALTTGVGALAGCGLGFFFTGTPMGCVQGGAGGGALGLLYGASGMNQQQNQGYQQQYQPQQQYNQSYYPPPLKPCVVQWSGYWSNGQWVKTGQFECEQMMNSLPPVLPPPPGM